MDLKALINIGAHFIGNNSPAILTGLGSVGVVTTAVLAVKGTPGAVETLAFERKVRTDIAYSSDLEDPYIEPLTKIEVIKLTWRNYVPAAVMGGATIMCIVGANSINTKRNAALATAYTLTDRAFREYKEKAVEVLGRPAEEKLRSEVAKDSYEKRKDQEVYIIGQGEQLCYDTLTGRAFMSDVETIRKAQNDINEMVNNSGYASMNDFYLKIGLPATTYGEEVGWRTDNTMSIAFSSILVENKKPAICIDYHQAPIRNYYKVW